MLSKLYDMQTTRIELPASLDDDRRYDFLLVLPRDESGQTIDRLMREAIEKHFRIGITHESRLMDVYVIRGMSAGGTIQQLCETLEETLDRPIIDETNLTGAYELNVRTGAATSGEFLQVMCDRLGLAAAPARRDVTMLVARLT